MTAQSAVRTFVWTLTADPVYMGTSTSTILRWDPVAPCVLVPDDTPHTVPSWPDSPDTSLEGYKVAGKSVGEVRAEIERRGLKAAYLITEPRQDRPDSARLPRYVMYPTKQNTPVGDDWFVWQADEPQQGTVRLMVTRELAKE
ncbi:hypothetical protein ABZ897_48480 [Nonomuraea sp. NPDC046802]|uniref:hypothetical protein n=1 Tax=Nonomuraea sp. NPDC046802 TaxID=3154919 RepID=UPI0033C59A18